VAEDDAFGLAGTAAGKEEQRLPSSALFGNAEQGGQQAAGSILLMMSHFAMLSFIFGSMRSMRMSCLLGGQGKLCILRTKMSAVRKRSMSPRRMALLDGGAAGGEVEVHRDLAGHDDRDIADESADARWQDDADALLFRLALHDLGQGERGGKDFVVARILSSLPSTTLLRVPCFLKP
jgi:hypothetical protein